MVRPLPENRWTSPPVDAHADRQDATKASLDGVSRTLLIPLYARANAASLLPSLPFDDAAARAVAGALAIDATDVGRDSFTMRLCIARSVALERALKGLLSRTSGRPVVLLACGLDTLPQRLGTGAARWLCADLPAVMAVRERLLPGGEGIEHVTATLPDHLGEVEVRLVGTRPIFVLEGVLPYLDHAQVAETLMRLTALAPQGGDLLLDGYHPALLAFARLADGIRRMRAHFRFGIADTRDYVALAPRLQHRAETDLLALLPWTKRLRTMLPALAAAGRPLAALAHLEITGR
jgi:O-methyltransferase involved in polyketide biosynthesis